VVPLKTRQVPPLELQTPPDCRPAGERFRGYDSCGRCYILIAERRRQNFNIVVFSELKVNIVVWLEANYIIVVRPEAEIFEPGWHRVICVPPKGGFEDTRKGDTTCNARATTGAPRRRGAKINGDVIMAP
jgi:hypothetical protein